MKGMDYVVVDFVVYENNRNWWKCWIDSSDLKVVILFIIFKKKVFVVI